MKNKGLKILPRYLKLDFKVVACMITLSNLFPEQGMCVTYTIGKISNSVTWTGTPEVLCVAHLTKVGLGYV